MDTIPLFKSHYSLGKSILTLNKRSSEPSTGPDSIIDICVDNKLKELYLVDDNMSGFLEAYENCRENKIKFIFGLRINVCPDLNQKDDESIQETSKLILFAKNREGYKKLIKLYTKASIEGFYYTPRLDYSSIKELYSAEDILVAVPFYDSFVHENTLNCKSCVPDLSFCSPVFMIEENDLPFNYLIENAVKKYAKSEDDLLKVKSVFYKNKEDFKSYLSFRCINSRSSLDKPNLEHMSSNEFCWEALSK
jgi:DNA polymerase-3 subunit alpha|tara:strand:+ start:1796 stop:2545 length:750 start_codon:yes stop_codon:yes gene_type:complete